MKKILVTKYGRKTIKLDFSGGLFFYKRNKWYFRLEVLGVSLVIVKSEF